MKCSFTISKYVFPWPPYYSINLHLTDEKLRHILQKLATFSWRFIRSFFFLFFFFLSFVVNLYSICLKSPQRVSRKMSFFVSRKKRYTFLGSGTVLEKRTSDTIVFNFTIRLWKCWSVPIYFLFHQPFQANVVFCLEVEIYDQFLDRGK